MAMRRTYASGQQKRKAADEKKQRDAELIAKIPKLANLFATQQAKAADGRVHKNAAEASTSQTNISDEQLAQADESFSVHQSTEAPDWEIDTGTGITCLILMYCESL